VTCEVRPIPFYRCGRPRSRTRNGCSRPRQVRGWRVSRRVGGAEVARSEITRLRPHEPMIMGLWRRNLSTILRHLLREFTEQQFCAGQQ
jgi:hypothetical protein